MQLTRREWQPIRKASPAVGLQWTKQPSSNVYKLFLVLQAINTQEANKAASNRLPPLWAMVAMVLLGWNEAMSILTSPVRLVSLCNKLACSFAANACVGLLEQTVE